MNDEEYNIRFHHPDHGTYTVSLNVRELDDDFLLSCKLPASEELITAQASDCFAALQAIRRKTEERGWSIHCLGSRRNVWPSAMSRDMGGGFKAYVLTIGQPATELVDILDVDESPDGSTVAEQESFAKSWFESLEK